MEQAPSRGSLLTSATALSDNGEKLVVGLPKGSTFALKMLDQPNIRAIVEGPIKEVFGERQIVFQEGTGSGRQIPEHARAAMRQRNAAPAQPASAPQSAPQPQPAPQPQSANQPQPAPQMRSQPTPQPAPRESYPMPWEEPAQPDVRDDGVWQDRMIRCPIASRRLILLPNRSPHRSHSLRLNSRWCLSLNWRRSPDPSKHPIPSPTMCPTTSRQNLSQFWRTRSRSLAPARAWIKSHKV